jgi:hypothetical protein
MRLSVVNLIATEDGRNALGGFQFGVGVRHLIRLSSPAP